jgi:hypothetical protein
MQLFPDISPKMHICVDAYLCVTQELDMEASATLW